MKDEYDKQIDKLKGQLSTAESDLKDYKKRLKQLNGIKSDIIKDFTGNLEDIYEKMKKAALSGVSGVRKSAGADIDCVYQSSEDMYKCVPDMRGTNFNDICTNMDSEISRVQTKIDTLEGNISSLERQIKNVKEAKKNAD